MSHELKIVEKSVDKRGSNHARNVEPPEWHLISNSIESLIQLKKLNEASLKVAKQELRKAEMEIQRSETTLKQLNVQISYLKKLEKEMERKDV